MGPGSHQEIWDHDGLIPLTYTCPLPWFLFFFQHRAWVCSIFAALLSPGGRR